MKKTLTFKSRNHFREWLSEHHAHHEGVWIRFDKRKNGVTVKPQEALEEALCFGWIDSTIRKLDDVFYVKYFAKRRPRSVWSEKNKRLVQRLVENGAMTHHGLKAVETAKIKGTWKKDRSIEDEPELESFHALIRPHEIAYENLMRMSPSVQKTYARHLFSAKRETTREKRLEEIVERLMNNLKPM